MAYVFLSICEYTGEPLLVLHDFIPYEPSESFVNRLRTYGPNILCSVQARECVCLLKCSCNRLSASLRVRIPRRLAFLF